MQTTRELPRKNLPERLLRERAIFKVHSDFVSVATRGATAVIDGQNSQDIFRLVFCQFIFVKAT